MVEPQVDGVPVVVQGGLVHAAAAETRVERVQRRLQVVGGTDGPGTGRRRGVRVVRTRARAVSATVAPAPDRAAAADGGGAGAAVGAYGAGRRTAVRGRVRGITATAPRRRLSTMIVCAVAAAAGAAAGAVSAAAPAPCAVPTAPGARYAIRRRRRRRVVRRGVRPHRPCSVHRRRVYAAVVAVVAGPNGPRYAVRAHVDDAFLDGRQPRRRGPLCAARGRSVRFGGRRRVLVQARVVRVRLTVVTGTAALVPRPMVLVVHVDRIYSETIRVHCMIQQSTKACVCDFFSKHFFSIHLRK